MKPKYVILSFLVFLLASSCRKFVEVDPPKDQLVTERVFDAPETANAAMLYVYTTMTNTSLLPMTVPAFGGLSADELTNLSQDITIKQIYANALQAKDSPTNAIWGTAYNLIYQANNIYAGCEKSSSLSSVVKNQLMGEALFVRAYWHFYLINLFGDVPLVTTPDYLVSSVMSRTPVGEVYKKIVTDLEKAIDLIGDKYVAADGITESLEKVRPNKAACKALLARVYLYMEKYADAEGMATQVIDHTEYDLIGLNAVFLKNSKEAIWQLMKPTPNFTQASTQEGYYFTILRNPLTNFGSYVFSISPSLFDAFEGGDLRKTNWINKFTDISATPNKEYYYPYKYKVRTSTNPPEYSMVFRLAEQYLIRAEARANQNNLDAAAQDLDKVRMRAGLGSIRILIPILTKENLLAAIMKERRIELFTEGAHRWLDLKRTKKIDVEMPAIATSKGTVWKTEAQLWPIPQKEIQNNPKLIQNKGYN